MPDQSTTLAQLKQLVEDFVAERDWHQFHSPKNLTMAMTIEAAELMEHFQWLTIDESRQLVNDPERLAAVGEEMADVLAYLLALANQLGIDLSGTLFDKMKKNRRKYPAP